MTLQISQSKSSKKNDGLTDWWSMLVQMLLLDELSHKNIHCMLKGLNPFSLLQEVWVVVELASGNSSDDLWQKVRGPGGYRGKV